ncbi:MAG: hypothetical protein U0Z75_09020 [Deinococcaceae bacterium]
MGTSRSSQAQTKKTLKPIRTQKYTRNGQRAHTEPWRDAIGSDSKTQTNHWENLPYANHALSCVWNAFLSRFGFEWLWT